MNSEYLLGPLIWSGIRGFCLSKDEKKAIQKLKVSGIILFKRNIESLEQLFELCKEIHSLKPAPLIVMDREGGPVDRLKHLPEFPPWPSPEKVTTVCSLEEIKKTGYYMGKEMRALGISVNFAPCVDVPSLENPLFTGRLLGTTYQDISQNALAYLHGLHKAGVAGCAKHFPGHGAVKEDSHLELPIDEREFTDLKEDLFPFQKMIIGGVDIIMSAHLLYPKVDSRRPVTLSRIFLKKLLRNKMGFPGLIISDDLDMKALQKYSLPKVMFYALKAGVDILLKCEPANLLELYEQLRQQLEKQNIQDIDLKLRRLQIFKQKYKLIKPIPSLAQLKKVLSEPKVHTWCKELESR